MSRETYKLLQLYLCCKYSLPDVTLLAKKKQCSLFSQVSFFLQCSLQLNKTPI